MDSINRFLKNRTVCEIMWTNIAEPGRPQTKIWRMRITCWIREAKNAHSDYAVHIALNTERCLHERASILRDTYIACLVSC